MLYNPKWNALSLESLIAWLEEQPPYQTYCYSVSDDCLLTQYFTAKGFTGVIMATEHFFHGPRSDRAITDLPEHFDRIALGNPSVQNQTFKSALTRARAAQGVL